MSDGPTPTALCSSDIDPFSEEFLTNPFPFLEQLRELGPVVYLEALGVWAVARHEEVGAVLRDHDTFSSAAGVGLDNLKTGQSWRPSSILLEIDPPLHTVNRRVVGRLVSPSALRVLETTFNQRAEKLAEELVERRRFDAVADLAEVFPTEVFPKALGLQGDVKDKLLAFGSLAFNGMGPMNARLQAALKDAPELMGWVAQHTVRSAFGPEGIGARMYEGVDTGEVSEEDASLLMRAFLSAGIDTTVSAIAFGIRAFASHPEQWSLLRADHHLARNAFEEVVRWESPVPGFFRTTTTSTTLAGCELPADAKVLVFFAGANRDPRHWDHPDTFDIRRKTGGHVGYGWGAHVCVGQNIARMEGVALFTALARRIESWRLTGEPRFRLCNTLRGLESLPVEVVPAA
ncbi:cytochrome P450 [Mycobacterium sp. E1747]|uniref:cytochrome P450 n=1 Tax=Mycobacterium sp. E1747 TaxID=1834128 RepID=UPI0007FE8118|nr:cytochrome P450 [Mycobacterium sp. E1747]OBH08189.1 cytochrome [Mycobacterium sp. E1747]